MYRAQGIKRSAGVFITEMKQGSGAAAVGKQLRVRNSLHAVSGCLIHSLDRAREFLEGPSGSPVVVVVEYWNGQSLQTKTVSIIRRVQQ